MISEAQNDLNLPWKKRTPANSIFRPALSIPHGELGRVVPHHGTVEVLNC